MKKMIFTILLIITLLSSCNDEKLKTKVYLGEYNLKGMSTTEVYDLLESIAQVYYIPPMDDKVDSKTWNIIEGHDGQEINKEMTIRIIEKAKNGETIIPVIDRIKAKRLIKIEQIASFETEILSTQEERLNNIRVASENIDGLIVLPHEEFSFNNLLGKRTIDKGYKPAPIFINTPSGVKTSQGVGGGICQVSTTLYNAAYEAGFKITERHMHSKKVNYIKEGNDATVVYNAKDLKFINSKEHPIMIKVRIKENKFLKIDILENKNSKI